jgi:hypothetical protein
MPFSPRDKLSNLAQRGARPCGLTPLVIWAIQNQKSRISNRLALGVLRSLASALETGLLAFLGARVARQIAGLAQHRL